MFKTILSELFSLYSNSTRSKLLTILLYQAGLGLEMVDISNVSNENEMDVVLLKASDSSYPYLPGWK